MNKSNDFRKGRTCVFLMHVHLVFVTKYRRKIFTKEILNDMKNIFMNVCKDFESELAEFDGEGDHVHLLINYPPKVRVLILMSFWQRKILAIQRSKSTQYYNMGS